MSRASDVAAASVLQEGTAGDGEVEDSALLPGIDRAAGFGDLVLPPSFVVLDALLSAVVMK